MNELQPFNPTSFCFVEVASSSFSMNLLKLMWGFFGVFFFSETLYSRIKRYLKSLDLWTINLLCDVPFLLYSVKSHLKYKEVNEVRIEKVGKFYQPSPT